MNKERNICIVGLGLLGGSYAMGLTDAGYTVTAVDVRPEAIRYALEKGIIAAGAVEDFAPLLAGADAVVLGALCKGETVIRNAARLRMKESDRIAAMEQELRKMGAELFSTQDTVTVRGGALHGADGLYGHNDHRVVMALAVAAYAAGVPAAIGGAEAVNKSWPDFFETVRALGGKVELTDE